MSARTVLLGLIAVASIGVLVALYAAGSSSEPAGADGPQTLPGFRVELVYAPPLETEGSWVSLAIDGRGRLIASDQYGLLYRVTPSPIGGQPAESRCEPIRLGVGAAQGMTFVNDALYVMVNAPGEAISSGLYRVIDSNGDDRFDDVDQLIPLRGSGEHGPHGVVASPDGQSLYFCAGNYTASPIFRKSRVPAGWGEDQLLPRLDDPAGQGTGVPAPGGWIVKCDLQGQGCELFSVGYRNIYDLAFNKHGELFTSDSDLDVDIGTPWYRPPAVLHATSGADFGWRGGDGIWPTYYPDTLPAAATMPPGSPTGLVAGSGTKFPQAYQQALFVGDWSRAAIYAVHLDPTGASYRGHCEPLASNVGAVTDLVVRPQDGALYFTVGGRQTQSGLYRIVWSDDTADVENTPASEIDVADEQAAGKARDERREFEKLHGEQAAHAETTIWSGLSSPDRFIRYAALTALERTDASLWEERAYSEPNVLARFTALIALARRLEPSRPAKWIESVLAVDFPQLSAEEQLTVVRTASLGVMRFDSLDSAMRRKLAAQVATWHPAQRRQVNRELAKLLVRLGSPEIVQTLTAQLREGTTSEQPIDAAVTLSAATTGWTTESRTALLDWFDLAAKECGTRSLYPYLVAARARFVAGFNGDERSEFAERLTPPRLEDASPAQSARKFVKNWTAEEAAQVVEASLKSQEPAGAEQLAGRGLYLALGCADCHAIGGGGTSVGPDLTNAGRRYSIADLARAITQPNDEVPDLYRQTTFVVGGRAITGRLTNMTAETVSVTTDMRDPASAVKLRREEIESQTPSPLSAMPSNLLDTLTASEVVALFAYLRGDSDDAEIGGPSQPLD